MSKKKPGRTGAKKAPVAATNGTNGTGRVVQRQVYLTGDLVSWLEDDRKLCEAQQRESIGPHISLTWSGHVAAILHQYRLARQPASAAKKKKNTNRSLHA